MTRIAFAILLLTLPVAAQVPLPPPPVAPNPMGVPGQQRDTKVQVPVGTASIEGAVVAPDSGRALAGARVSINGNGMPISRSVVTDQSGRFSFGQLPAGQYSLNASRARYLSASYGQKAPDRQGTPIRLVDGQQLKNVTIRLFTGSVITGTLFDERGEPAMNAQVRLSRYVMRGGLRQLQQTGQNSTDDRGIYRFHGLVPGEYIVSATLSQNGSAQADQAAAAVERAIAAAGARAAAGGTTMQTSTGTVPAVTIDNAFNNSDFGGQSMPAPTYYPGTTSASTATSVRLAAGEERGGIDFQAQPTTTVTVQGLVISPGGSLPAGISVQMMSDDAEAGAFSASGRVDAEGRFTFRNVAPGQYALTARAQPSPPAPMPAVNGTSVPGTPQAAAAKPLYGRTVVIVSDTNVNGIAVTLDAGRTVAGHVVFDGSAKVPDLSKSRLNASMQIAPGVNQTMPSSNVIVGADGHFSITGVQPGRYVLRVTGAQGWYLRSSTINGQDALDVPVEIGGQDVQNAVVTFVDRTTELSGLLQDSQSQPAPDYTIVVFSADERFWPGSTRRVVQTRPATDGRYTITNLPPGDYYIAALTDMEPGASSDPQFLRLLVSSAARITLNDGDKKTQDLRVGR